MSALKVNAVALYLAPKPGEMWISNQPHPHLMYRSQDGVGVVSADSAHVQR